MRLPALRGWTPPLSRLAWPFAAALAVTAVAAGVVTASDHQDTPFVEMNQRFDVNDVYAFPAATPGRIALVLGTSSPLTPAGTPTARFGDKSEALYQLKIDNNRDGVEDLVFQITFTTRSDGQSVTVIGPVRPNQVGTANTLVTSTSLPGRMVTGRTNQVLGSPNAMQVFAGPRDDPFFIDLERFFAILPDRRPVGGPLSVVQPPQSSFRSPSTAFDFVRGLNDLAIVIEVPTAWLTDSGHRPQFGVWGTASMARTANTL